MPADITKSSSDRTASTIEERNRRRSERVALRVPVELSAMMPHGTRINIQAHTLVVNAHGGLLDVGMEIARGQRIRLSNLQTETTASAFVLRVEASGHGRFAVAFEFESPASHFWPISFPPTDWHSPGAK